MIKKNYKIRSDLHNDVYNSSIKFNISDEVINAFNVNITRLSKSLNDVKATVYISTPKGKMFNIPGEIVQDKYVLVKLPNDKLLDIGSYIVQISFVNGKKRVVTNEFKFEVTE